MKKSSVVTTGINAQNKSVIISKHQASIKTPMPQFSGLQVQELFYTEDSPLSLITRHLTKQYHHELPEGALRIMKMRIPTTKEVSEDLARVGEPVPSDWRTFNVHKNNSIDFVYVLSGQLTVTAGNEEVDLKEGDFLAQIGPEHTWFNDHNEPCYLLCVVAGI